MSNESIVLAAQIKTYGSTNTIHVKGSHHRITIPQVNEKLALYLGLMWGDGCISNRPLSEKTGNWRIHFVEDDTLLLPEFIALVSEIFSIKPHVYFKSGQTKVYEVCFSSRIVYELLNVTFGYPDGLKKDRLVVPKQITKDTNLLRTFLSGLFTTDGTVYSSSKYGSRISFATASRAFAEEIHIRLTELGFNPKLNPYHRKEGNILYNIRLNGIKQLRLFRERIGFIGDKREKLDKILSSPFV